MRHMRYDVMIAAIDGDAVALQAVIDHFGHYINALSTRPYVDKGGQCRYGVDAQMKWELCGALLRAVPHFTI